MDPDGLLLWTNDLTSLTGQTERKGKQEEAGLPGNGLTLILSGFYILWRGINCAGGAVINTAIVASSSGTDQVVVPEEFKGIFCLLHPVEHHS